MNSLRCRGQSRAREGGGLRRSEGRLGKGLAWAKYDPDKTSPEELVKAVNENTAFEAKRP